MIADEFPEIGLRAPVRRGGASQSLRLETADPDGVVAAALAAGAGWSGRSPTRRTGGAAWSSTRTGTGGWSPARCPTAHPGDVVYASLWAPDAGRARRFFDGVLGGLGALGTRRGSADPDVLLRGARRRRGRVAVRAAGGTADDPRDEPHGRTADCVDDQGIPFALHPGAGTPPLAGPLAYVELRVPDARRGPARSTAPCWVGVSSPGARRATGTRVVRTVSSPPR